VCSGSPSGFRDFDDFSSTQELIALAGGSIRSGQALWAGWAGAAAVPPRRRAVPSLCPFRRLSSRVPVRPTRSATAGRGGRTVESLPLTHPSRERSAAPPGRHPGDDAWSGRCRAPPLPLPPPHSAPARCPGGSPPGAEPAAVADEDRNVAGPLGVHHLSGPRSRGSDRDVHVRSVWTSSPTSTWK